MWWLCFIFLYVYYTSGNNQIYTENIAAKQVGIQNHLSCFSFRLNLFLFRDGCGVMIQKQSNLAFFALHRKIEVRQRLPYWEHHRAIDLQYDHHARVKSTQG